MTVQGTGLASEPPYRPAGPPPLPADFAGWGPRRAARGRGAAGEETTDRRIPRSRLPSRDRMPRSFAACKASGISPATAS
jgi:hypothetical protein